MLPLKLAANRKFIKQTNKKTLWNTTLVYFLPEFVTTLNNSTNGCCPAHWRYKSLIRPQHSGISEELRICWHQCRKYWESDQVCHFCILHYCKKSNNERQWNIRGVETLLSIRVRCNKTGVLSDETGSQVLVGHRANYDGISPQCVGELATFT